MEGNVNGTIHGMFIKLNNGEEKHRESTVCDCTKWIQIIIEYTSVLLRMLSTVRRTMCVKRGVTPKGLGFPGFHIGRLFSLPNAGSNNDENDGSMHGEVEIIIPITGGAVESGRWNQRVTLLREGGSLLLRAFD